MSRRPSQWISLLKGYCPPFRSSSSCWHRHSSGDATSPAPRPLGTGLACPTRVRAESGRPVRIPPGRTAAIRRCRDLLIGVGWVTSWGRLFHVKRRRRSRVTRFIATQLSSHSPITGTVLHLAKIGVRTAAANTAYGRPWPCAGSPSSESDRQPSAIPRAAAMGTIPRHRDSR